MKKERLLTAFSFIDEKYVKEAESKMINYSSSSMSKMGRVACFILVVALSLYLFIPISDKGPNLTAYQDSDYFPLIEKIAAYRYQPSPFKNNFHYLASEAVDFISGLTFAGSAPSYDKNDAPTSSAPSMDGSSNGSYEEVTDNQVDGVIEADLMKRTDKYIFRLGLSTLKVYEINKDDTAEVASFDFPGFEDTTGEKSYEREMYLSEDASTVTVIYPYLTKSYNSRLRIISIDVSDLSNIHITSTFSIDGSYNTSRMVDGKLILVTEYSVKNADIDYTDPATFVPSITIGEVTSPLEFDDIIYPEKIGSTRYSVVAMLDEKTLECKKAYALLDFYNDIYVSENHVFVTREYSEKEYIGDDGSFISNTKSDVIILDYTGDTIVKKGVVTTNGVAKDQYSMDEYEGHLRIVTSTTERTSIANSFKNSDTLEIGGVIFNEGTLRSATLTVFNLETLTQVGVVRNFAPNGESVQSARFDGTSAYVCTAVRQTFTDPVFFFDLTDYSNITYTDTGVIEGFSSSLIQLGDGFLLGIGEENRDYSKVEVYEERNGTVVSVDSYKYIGDHSEDYKSYFIDREENLFGFAITGYCEDYDSYYYYPKDVYVLLCFNGYELVEVFKMEIESIYRNPSRIRAFEADGYIYITSDSDVTVVSIF